MIHDHPKARNVLDLDLRADNSHLSRPYFTGYLGSGQPHRVRLIYIRTQNSGYLLLVKFRDEFAP